MNIQSPSDRSRRPKHGSGESLAVRQSLRDLFIFFGQPNMELRSGQVVGAHLLPPEAKAAFEEGVRLLFKRWTALVLAVENQWGGPTSADKANWLLQETLAWFDKNKEHYWDDLEEELADALLQDFNVETEDGSPAEVAKSLCELHAECLRQDYSTVLRLREQVGRATTGAAASRRQVVDRDGTVMGDDDSSSDDEDDDDAMQQDDVPPHAVPLEPQGPVVDADGFTLVQKPGRRGARR